MGEKDLMTMYLDDIRKYEILTKEEELDLLIRAKSGEEEAKKMLIVSNLRLVVNVAKGYNIRNMSLIDVISEGNFGLMHAIEKFDLEKGNRFSTYAVWWIKQAISKAMINKGRDIRIPSYKFDLINKVNKIIGEQIHTKGITPHISKIAQEMNMSHEKLARVMVEFQDVVSLNATVGDELPLEDTLSLIHDKNLEDEIMDKVSKEQLRASLKCLTPREAEIIRMRYGLDGSDIYTLEEVGDIFKITRERVRQIEKRSIEKLKKRYLSF